MAKAKTIYVCDNCGNETPRWAGKCLNCGAWNTLKEMRTSFKTKDSRSKTGEPRMPQTISKISTPTSKQRTKTSISEFDRVIGGGVVSGSVILLGGDPGIGKSTVLLQISASVNNTLYISGEESLEQIKMRADRLGLKSNFRLVDETDIERIIDLASQEKPRLLIIDSIQSMYDPETEGTPGGITQVKSSALKLQQLAKSTGIAVVLVGHITKSGAVAGPKTLEHLVDVVLYLEGDKYHEQRVLRAIKNRFGSTGESGIFEMTSSGLKEIKNPSELFISRDSTSRIGSVVTASIEGTRPILLEVQALTSKTVFGYPKRAASGVDLSRVQLLSAVVSEATSVNLQVKDVYVNIVGGVRVKEPAVDLAICTTLVSSALKKELKENPVVVGEVGLTGEIREVSGLEKRIREAKKMGFENIIIPRTRKKFRSKEIKIIEVSHLKEIEKLLAH